MSKPTHHKGYACSFSGMEVQRNQVESLQEQLSRAIKELEVQKFLLVAAKFQIAELKKTNSNLKETKGDTGADLLWALSEIEDQSKTISQLRAELESKSCN